MQQSNTPKDAIVLYDTTSATGTGAVTWAKTGLQYINLTGIGNLSLQATGTYNLSTQYQLSNDLTTWVSAPMQNSASVPLAENTGVVGVGAGMFDIPVRGWRYFRVNISAYTSGTWVGTVSGKTGSATPATQPVVAMQDGAWVFSTNGNYPTGSTAVTSSSGNVANASAVATLAGVSAKVTYLTGFQISSSGATAASVVTVTVVGVTGGTMSYAYPCVAGVTAANNTLAFAFPFPIPASTTNTAIVVTLPALGAGNTNATVSAQGYQL